jgi:hypothetical protein
MINRAAVIASLLFSFAAVAHADDAAPVEQTQTTTAQTLVVVTPNAPIIVTNGVQQPAPAAVISAPGTTEAVTAAPAAPQNESWSNVSHINGSIVPVGERNAYLYDFKKTNLQSNPLAWMFGYYQIAASHALSGNVALSVEVSGWSIEHGTNSGYQLAATLPIYFKRTFSGPFLEPGLVINNSSSSDCYDCYTYDAAGNYTGNSPSMSTRTWVGPEVMFGWAWMFDSGLNVSAAFGAAKQLSDSQGTNQYSSSSDDPVPVGYFRVGYAF